MQFQIFLIGTGQMAIDYATVFIAEKYHFTVIGRGETSAQLFEQKTGIKPITGGIANYIQASQFPENSYVIIATGTQDLMQTMLIALNAGAKRVLIEKPAALSIEELLSYEEKLKPFADRIFVAYNRRFYASVIEAQRLIKEDGGLESMHFEFTEWSHIIETIDKAPGVKENWFFANSSHVVDLAFFFAGYPKEWNCFTKMGRLKWHKYSFFSGAGITTNGVVFSYNSNWESAGRWSIELFTRKRRIFLKPLEKVSMQHIGDISIVEHGFDDNYDHLFKPGLYLQIKSFLELNDSISSLKNIKEQIDFARDVCSKMLS